MFIGGAAGAMGGGVLLADTSPASFPPKRLPFAVRIQF
jgi:hypothetical protein